jgi:hypothetical protein
MAAAVTVRQEGTNLNLAHVNVIRSSCTTLLLYTNPTYSINLCNRLLVV